jgi:hypothetical protein
MLFLGLNISMETMLVGILESRNDRFINDVVSRLGGVDVEFMSSGIENAPIKRGYRVVVDRLSFRYPFLRCPSTPCHDCQKVIMTGVAGVTTNTGS